MILDINYSDAAYGECEADERIDEGLIERAAKHLLAAELLGKLDEATLSKAGEPVSYTHLYFLKCCRFRKTGTIPLRDYPISTRKAFTPFVLQSWSLKKRDISKGCKAEMKKEK